MKNLFTQLGSLHSLVAFESAARLSSFTRAAEEIGVSQPAVSQAVRQLENAIGSRLFHRRHRQIALTDAGELLYYDVRQGFERISSTVQHLTRQGQPDHVTLSVSTAFANYWVVPRLQDLHQHHPEIDLRLQTTDKELDLAQEGLALGVRRGNGLWPGYQSRLLSPERLSAVASPGWLNRNRSISSVAALAQSTLIHLDGPYRERPSWPDWFAAFEHRFSDNGSGLRLNDYALVLQASIAGEGIALGWEHVSEKLIAQGLLQRVGSWRWETGAGFYLVWSDNTELTTAARTVRDWILGHGV